jgi:hypothetical protein
MDILNTILLLIILTFNIVLLKKPKYKKFDLPAKVSGIMTPNGRIIVREKKEPIYNDDATMWEREQD